MLSSSQPPILVGDRMVDLARETLRDGRGDIVPLRPRAWAVLRLLATRPGQLISKDEIMDEVWSDCEVTEDSLVQAIGDVRRALGDAGRSALKTMPRRGYMLVVDEKPITCPATHRGHPIPQSRRRLRCRICRSSFCLSPTSAAIPRRTISSMV
ncbi:winged helix-turn-helix domain-containing protein [Bradyrhizobium sp. B117]|uniref:winged helix-turn-helix domain-containing protein n=1 Tax=Bradyrhizobium sp. B117 TaxID=3140246 RepID=UPI00318328F7